MPASNHALRRYLVLSAVLIKLCVVSFYIGYRNAVNESEPSTSINVNPDAAAVRVLASSSSSKCTTPTEISVSMRQKIDARVKEELLHTETESYTDKIFPDTMRDFAVGALRVPRDDLLNTYDFGVPVKRQTGKTESIILYNAQSALPEGRQLKHEAVHGINGEIASSDVTGAMENCDTMNVIMTSLKDEAECHVIMGNFESYHINRWMRMPPFDKAHDKAKKRIANSTLPLRHVGRVTLGKNGVDEFDLPELWKNKRKGEKGFLLEHFDRLNLFLENVDKILGELKDLLEKRKVVRDNTVVVMTVNAGQSELLSNFVCAARSRGLDTGNVLVFPTDEESYKLAKGLGVATYFDRINLGALPSGEAKMYGDPIFAAMMGAKILCVLYVTLLGHDVLFQDVDIVWFKDPLEYFHDKSNTAIQNFDILFQHDGSAQPRYNPFSANSGFYYVRANKKCQYLFTSLMYHGAVVRKSKSHQQVLVQLLNEHSSLFGLHVKVFDKLETDMFPGGFHYHQNWETMHNIIDGTSNAYLLHMSWTENKVNKLLFFRQMGEWYVNEKCISKDLSNLITVDGGKVSDGSLINQCCSIEPIFSCHYQDKPSKIPCRDSPKIDPKKGRPFWK